ncbi:MAG: HD domain-containing protein [Clostridiales bacterium]|mgnify:FL=1|uniref:HD domain-containing protein n=1 Tax=Candidatus Pullilachnospira stercoravium TaxID=2840913 RepID=A0A9D1NWZ6_9FIRM|nr:HD domain-containing protein [Clostridiales bacterium]HIV13580.1 HD domain-containing protein [Candidatus Pullilachnospira stercoravium]
MNERLKKQKEFLLEVDKMKQIYRQTHIRGGSRQENDAEHSWHLALMAFLLEEYANEPVDITRVMKMVLIHDLVEVDAGDTYAYDTAGNATKRQREEAAADRIFGILPEDQGKMLRQLWEEFEAYETPEARFAHVMDNFQPMTLNDDNGGGDWKRHQVKKSQILKRNEKTSSGSREIWSCMEEMIQENIEKGNIIDE